MMPAALAENGTITGGEGGLFWVVAPIVVVLALGLLFARKAIYAAMSVVGVMIGLAFFYAAQQAPFLAVAQVVVYTGAIMMLFLFVLMLVGVDASDSVVETIKGQRWVAALAGLGLVLVLGAVAASGLDAPAVGLDEANTGTNPVGVARLIFSDYVFTMEVVGTLLVVAAVGALTYNHRERLTPPKRQPATAAERLAAWTRGQGRTTITPQPAPGVYARSNAADLPALSATGEPLQDSVPRILRIRGQQRTIGEVSPETAQAVAAAKSGHGPGVHGPAATRSVRTSGLPSMPGEPPPQVPGTAVEVREEGER